jgi:hypothetical protein
MKIYSHSTLYSESKILKLNLKGNSAQLHNYIVSVQKNNSVNTVNYYAAANTLMTFVITDISGKVIYRTQRQVNAGNNKIEFSSSISKAKGIHVLQLVLQNDKLSYKIIL